MSKQQHHYEFPLDPTLLDELSVWRDEPPAPADHRSRAAIYAASFVHAATEFGSRLGRRMHLTRDERTRH